MTPIVWTPGMVDALHNLRSRNVALRECAHVIGVDHEVATRKARELGIADRRNRGRTRGEYLIERKTA